MTTAEISDYADMILTAIRDDIAAGTIPADVASFTELHDYVDANEYALAVIPGADAALADPESDNYTDWMALTNAVTDQVDERIKAGELLAEAAAPETRIQDMSDVRLAWTYRRAEREADAVNPLDSERYAAAHAILGVLAAETGRRSRSNSA